MKKNKKKELLQDKEITQQIIHYLESNSGGAIVSKIMLATIALGGVALGGAVAPNIIRSIEATRRYASQNTKKLNTSSVQSIISRFKRDGYVYIEKQSDGKIVIRLTPKGHTFVKDYTYQPRIPQPKIWDRRWRVIIFDIPLEKNRQHTIFLRCIKEMGFRQIQKSVYVYPFKCEDEIFLIAKRLEIDSYIEIMTVSKMLHEDRIKKFFFKRKKKNS